jgi:hypothetical protein
MISTSETAGKLTINFNAPARMSQVKTHFQEPMSGKQKKPSKNDHLNMWNALHSWKSSFLEFSRFMLTPPQAVSGSSSRIDQNQLFAASGSHIYKFQYTTAA